ncbi:unnamed protein product [Prunus armeniaca]|uniref:Uncharacterized protein n=1 Tax=Prunus armeniaca TaxID=36596 RepID=A0A6J5VCD5_PRUAR|nr:unnamed protein product [Prunus armeniaca]
MGFWWVGGYKDREGMGGFGATGGEGMGREKIHVALCVQNAALQFIKAGAGDQSNENPGQDEYKLSEDARTAGLSIHPDVWP